MCAETGRAQMPQLPLELLAFIISIYHDTLHRAASARLYLDEVPALPPLMEFAIARRNAKPAWTDFASIVETSHAVRELALVQWFSTLCLRTPSCQQELDVAFAFPCQRFARWVRTVYIVADDDFELPRQELYLGLIDALPSSLPNLVGVRIAKGPWPVTFYARLPGDFPVHAMLSVENCDLLWQSWLTPHLTQPACDVFPHLRTLSLHSGETWCGLCNLSRKLSVAPGWPLTLLYVDGMGLPSYFGKTLAPLQHLRSVMFIISARIDSGGVELRPGWSGECGECCTTILDRDAPFCKTWMEQKSTAPQPPSLRHVEWNFRLSAHVAAHDSVSEGSELDDSDDDSDAGREP